MSLSLRRELGDPRSGLRAGLEEVGAASARVLPPAARIHRAWLDHAGPFGQGIPSGPVHAAGPAGTSHLRDFTWGGIGLADREPVLYTDYEVTVRLAALACHHTDDPSGTDEPYVVASVGVLDSAPTPQVVTTVLGPGTATPRRGHPAVLLKSQLIGTVRPRGAGVLVHLAVSDTEMGGRDKVRADVETYMKEVISTAGKVVGGMIAAGDLATASAVVSDVGNTIFGRDLLKRFSEFVAGIFADDLIGETSMIVNATDVVQLATPDGLRRRLLRRADLDPDVEFTHPVEHDGPSWQIGGRGQAGDYRAYLMVNSAVTQRPW